MSLKGDAAMSCPIDEVGGEGATMEAIEHRLEEIPLRQVVELVRIDMPEEGMVPLLERGIVPGCRLCPIRRSPTGDPILMVDGVLIALRREMAKCMCVRFAEEEN
jgi:Fe2+ transport system protein FeoA